MLRIDNIEIINLQTLFYFVALVVALVDVKVNL